MTETPDELPAWSEKEKNKSKKRKLIHFSEFDGDCDEECNLEPRPVAKAKKKPTSDKSR